MKDLKDLFEKIDLIKALAVIVAGAALIACVVTGPREATLVLGGGLAGCLGAVAPTKT